MAAFLTPLLAWSTVALDILIVIGFFALLARRTWGRAAVRWLGEHAVLLGFLLAFAALLGSLIYSNVIGYAPCELCWWQRICLYPLAVIFLVDLLKKRARNPFDYALPLASIAALVALYHTYIELGGSVALGDCTTAGGACAKVYVLALGYVTIPTMSLTVALAIILLGFIMKQHEDRHA